MTDKERLIALLEDFGIVYSLSHPPVGEVTVEAKMGPKQSGYSGFATSFEFTPEGTFKEMGIWE